MGSTERREREQQMRRRRIMAAARRVLADKGFRGATMEEIAEEADYKPATLYLYFKNKDELRSSLVVEQMQNVASELRALGDRTDLDTRGKVRLLPKIFYRIYQFDPPVLLDLFRLQAGQDLSNVSPEMINTLNELAATGIRALARVYQAGIDEGLFRPHHPVAMADSTWAVFCGLVLWEESKRVFGPDRDKRFLQSTLEFALNLMIDGLIGPGHGPGTGTKGE